MKFRVGRNLQGGGNGSQALLEGDSGRRRIQAPRPARWGVRYPKLCKNRTPIVCRDRMLTREPVKSVVYCRYIDHTQHWGSGSLNIRGGDYKVPTTKTLNRV